MAKTLNIGKQFEGFSSLEIAIQQYQKEENVQFFRRQKLTLKVIEIQFYTPPIRLSVRQSVQCYYLFSCLEVI